MTEVALFVRQFGSGDPLLLIHGLMVSGAMYQEVLPALAMHYCLVVPDLRGHGRSSALGGPYSVEQLEGDLAQLLDYLHIDSAHILGYSQGGAVAQQFARLSHARARPHSGLHLCLQHALAPRTSGGHAGALSGAHPGHAPAGDIAVLGCWWWEAPGP